MTTPNWHALLKDVGLKMSVVRTMVEVLAPQSKMECRDFYERMVGKLRHLSAFETVYSGENKEHLTVTASYTDGRESDVFTTTLNTEMPKNAQRHQASAP